MSSRIGVKAARLFGMGSGRVRHTRIGDDAHFLEKVSGRLDQSEYRESNTDLIFWI
jgi:hypothetical protein